MGWNGLLNVCHCLNADHLLLPDVQVPGVVLVVGDVDPVVVCDHPLVQAQDRLVTSLIGNIFGKQKIFLKVSPSP